jgi:anthranilate/para-aminobenzoate synthase component I
MRLCVRELTHVDTHAVRQGRYEMRAECGSSTTAAAATPDAAFFFADRLLAVDHLTDAVYALALYHPASASSSAADTAAAAWLQATHAAVSEVRRTEGSS